MLSIISSEKIETGAFAIFKIVQKTFIIDTSNSSDCRHLKITTQQTRLIETMLCSQCYVHSWYHLSAISSSQRFWDETNDFRRGIVKLGTKRHKYFCFEATGPRLVATSTLTSDNRQREINRLGVDQCASPTTTHNDKHNFSVNDFILSP